MELIPVPVDQWASISIPYELHVQWVEAENERQKKIANPSEELQKQADEIGMTVEQLLCPSTHGGAGYGANDYWNEDGNIVCGICSFVIENPHSFGGQQEFAPGWRGWLLGHSRTVPTWGFMGQNKKALEKYWERNPEKAEFRKNG